MGPFRKPPKTGFPHDKAQIVSVVHVVLYKAILPVNVKFYLVNVSIDKVHILVKAVLIEPRREKTGFLHMRKQRRRSAAQ